MGKKRKADAKVEAATPAKDGKGMAATPARIGDVEVRANGQVFRFHPQALAAGILELMADMCGPCIHTPAFLSSPEQHYFLPHDPLPPGIYTYELRDKVEIHPRFGHLYVPSSLNLDRTREIQMDEQRRNLNFRPVDAAPFLPLQLVHEAFAVFLDDIRVRGERPTEVDYDFYLELVKAASSMLDEGKLTLRVWELFKEYFSGLTVIDYMCTGWMKERSSHTDVGIREGDAVVLLTEIKTAIAGTTTDPQMQAIANYKMNWTKRTEEADSFADTAYPAFVLEIVGQSVKIGGLVTFGGESGGKVCYQQLASVDLYGIFRHDTRMAEDGVVVFVALKKALQTLNEYWRKLRGRGRRPNRMLEKLIHSKKLPYVLHRYKDKVTQIGNRLVYVVQGGVAQQMKDDCVVKFVQAYGVAVHEAWSNAGFAPRLYYTSKVSGGWFWVAMELLKEEDGWKCLATLDEEAADRMRPQVLKQLDKAHRVDVKSADGTPGRGAHGDMRDVNVMVMVHDGKLKRVKFIDFDWARIEGDCDAYYPGFMNPEINWPEGVGAGKCMSQIHDRLLLELPRKQQLKSSSLPEDSNQSDSLPSL